MRATRARRIVLVTPDDRDELAGAAGQRASPAIWSSRCAPPRSRRASPRAAGASTRPIRRADDATRTDATRRRNAGLAILVAEDNEINALLARALLARLGHRPTIVGDRRAGGRTHGSRRARAGEPYDLVLMDVHMPELDGIEATRRIRAAEAAAGGPRTPIVALTANAFGEDRDACLAAGMDGFLTKPLDRERLAELLARRGARRRSRLAAASTRTHSFRSATSSTRWLSPFLRMRSARWRVGRMFSCRLTRLMRVQMSVAVATASASVSFE